MITMLHTYIDAAAAAASAAVADDTWMMMMMVFFLYTHLFYNFHSVRFLHDAMMMVMMSR